MRPGSLNAVNLPPLEIQANETCCRHYLSIIVLLTLFNGIAFIFNIAFFYLAK